MAKATEVPPIPPPNVLLELTPEEAGTLVAILAMVGGSASSSPREHADAIRDALNGVGYSFSTGLGKAAHSLIRGSTQFSAGRVEL